jgi:hypothetical protein
MSSEEIFCAKCSNLVEEALLLACQHNLCLFCAAENLSRDERKGMNRVQVRKISKNVLR